MLRIFQRAAEFFILFSNILQQYSGIYRNSTTVELTANFRRKKTCGIVMKFQIKTHDHDPMIKEKKKKLTKNNFSGQKKNPKIIKKFYFLFSSLTCVF